MKKMFMNGLVAVLFVVSSFIVSVVPADTAEAAACKSYTFRRGSYGECVRNIQKMLNGIAYEYGGVYNGGGGCGDPYMDRGLISIDASFGPETQAKVKRFQHWSCIATDGVVGPITWSRLCRDATWYGTTKSAIYDAGYYAAKNSGC